MRESGKKEKETFAVAAHNFTAQNRPPSNSRANQADRLGTALLRVCSTQLVSPVRSLTSGGGHRSPYLQMDGPPMPVLAMAEAEEVHVVDLHGAAAEGVPAAGVPAVAGAHVVYGLDGLPAVAGAVAAVAVPAATWARQALAADKYQRGPAVAARRWTGGYHRARRTPAAARSRKALRRDMKDSAHRALALDEIVILIARFSSPAEVCTMSCIRAQMTRLMGAANGGWQEAFRFRPVAFGRRLAVVEIAEEKKANLTAAKNILENLARSCGLRKLPALRQSAGQSFDAHEHLTNTATQALNQTRNQALEWNYLAALNVLAGPDRNIEVVPDFVLQLSTWRRSLWRLPGSAPGALYYPSTRLWRGVIRDLHSDTRKSFSRVHGKTVENVMTWLCTCEENCHCDEPSEISVTICSSMEELIAKFRAAAGQQVAAVEDAAGLANVLRNRKRYVEQIGALTFCEDMFKHIKDTTGGLDKPFIPTDLRITDKNIPGEFIPLPPIKCRDRASGFYVLPVSGDIGVGHAVTILVFDQMDDEKKNVRDKC